MNLASLYLQARFFGPAVVGGGVTGCFGWIWGWRHPGDPTVLWPALVFCPLAAACILGVSTYSPFGEIERTSSYPLALLRLGHLGGVFGLNSLILVTASASWHRSDAPLVLLRNLAGFAGLACLCALVLGGRLAWLLPLAFGMAAYLAGGSNEEGGWRPAQWAWPMQSGADPVSALIAVSTLLVGFGAVVLFGVNESREAEG